VRVLVTGINGFVGGYLEQELHVRGHEVKGLDVTSGNNNVYVTDITDLDSVVRVVRDTVPDFVIHLAGIAQVDFNNPGILYNINTTGTVNLLTACADTGAKLLFISSSQVYGNIPSDMLPVSENCPINPVNHYGASKAAAENIVKAFICANDVECVIVRPFNHTGRGQTAKFVVPKIVNAFREKAGKIELGNVETIRDFLDVRDVVRGYVDIIENFRSGSVYNIASGKPVKIIDIVYRLKEITGSDMDVDIMESLFRKSDILSVLGSYVWIKSEIGWEPKYQIEDTLRCMLG
jgi:nucleoside-diphosphate-sugar epimerase